MFRGTNKKSSKFKLEAIRLRKEGNSIRDIEINLGLPRSTLSGWLKPIQLTYPQKVALLQRWRKGLEKARVKAAEAHRRDKQNRINDINKQAERFIIDSKINNTHLEIFLAGLYLGDGFKVGARVGLGSSNPQILKTFVTLLRKLYNIDEKKLRAAIYARSDQNVNNLKNFWSNLLQIPVTKFHKTQIDKRTSKKKTYPNYKGVCAVIYFNAAIQRRLMAISNVILGRVAQSVRAFA